MSKKKLEIKKEAKQILDKFAKALEKVKTNDESFHVEREKFEREERNSEKCNFKKKLLKNAPEHDDDFIIVERGNWK